MFNICRHYYRKRDGFHFRSLTTDQTHAILFIVINNMTHLTTRNVHRNYVQKPAREHRDPNLNAIAEYNAQLSKITSTRVFFERAIKSILKNLPPFYQLISNHMTQYVNYRIQL